MAKSAPKIGPSMAARKAAGTAGSGSTTPRGVSASQAFAGKHAKAHAASRSSKSYGGGGIRGAGDEGMGQC